LFLLFLFSDRATRTRPVGELAAKLNSERGKRKRRRAPAAVRVYQPFQRAKKKKKKKKKRGKKGGKAKEEGTTMGGFVAVRSSLPAPARPPRMTQPPPAREERGEKRQRGGSRHQFGRPAADNTPTVKKKGRRRKGGKYKIINGRAHAARDAFRHRLVGFCCKKDGDEEKRGHPDRPID